MLRLPIVHFALSGVVFCLDFDPLFFLFLFHFRMFCLYFYFYFLGFQAQHFIPSSQEMENYWYGQWPTLSKFNASNGTMVTTFHMQQ